MNAGVDAANKLDEYLDAYVYNVYFPLCDATGNCECGCVKYLLDQLMIDIVSLKARMIDTRDKLRELHHACKIKSV